MAIDESSDFWTGSEPADIADYLDAYTSCGGGYPATAFLPVICRCRSDGFFLARAGSSTKRTCSKCGEVRYMSRSGEAAAWEEDAEECVESYRCMKCGGNESNVCLGFADYACHPGYKDNRSHPLPDAVLWFFVGVRCSKCGLLDCFNDGKVGFGPMAERTFREIAGEQPYKGSC
jgi:hypothetical protein